MGMLAFRIILRYVVEVDHVYYRYGTMYFKTVSIQIPSKTRMKQSSAFSQRGAYFVATKFQFFVSLGVMSQ